MYNSSVYIYIYIYIDGSLTGDFSESSEPAKNATSSRRHGGLALEGRLPSKYIHAWIRYV